MFEVFFQLVWCQCDLHCDAVGVEFWQLWSRRLLILDLRPSRLKQRHGDFAFDELTRRLVSLYLEQLIGISNLLDLIFDVD